MNESNLIKQMKEQCASKELLAQAQQYAYEYIDAAETMTAFPSAESLELLKHFEEPFPEATGSAADVLEMLHNYGAPNTVVGSGPHFFGFICGGALPVASATQWIVDTWDQNSARYLLSPVSSKIEEICEKWLVELFSLPKDTALGVLSGASGATICAIATARNHLLKKLGWDVTEKGLFGAPPITVILGAEAHVTIWRALTLLGIGREQVKIAPVDGEGRIIADQVPKMDDRTILVLQAGNFSGTAFDPFETLCERAAKVGAWVHIDGAVGLWAVASHKFDHLTKGFDQADSLSLDAHKTLNAPLDCGILLCKHRQSLLDAMQAPGFPVDPPEPRNNNCYSIEMSHRARCIELWAMLKYLGRAGIAELVESLASQASYLAEELTKNGFIIANEVSLNQCMVRCATPELTAKVLSKIQTEGKIWCNGATWKGEPAIRINIASWQTTHKHIDETVQLMIAYRDSD